MLPLEGLTVIAVEQAVAAPFCSSRLADAGAHVIKIERPEGDFARGYDAAAKGQSSYFVWLNRGKDSVVIDLATKEGRASLEALIAGADVLLQNLKPGSMDKLGFALERLRKDYPKLICCTISGYGDDGPYAHRKAYDLLIQAESGLASITGGPEGPSRVGVSIVDVATGATAHAAILEALIARSRSGKGADIRISMFDVMADWLTVPLLNAEAGNPPQRLGLAHPSIAPYGVFRSKDGKDILISIQSEREWKKLCADVLGQPDLPERSEICQHGRARPQPRPHRQDRRRRLCGHDPRRAVAAAVRRRHRLCRGQHHGRPRPSPAFAADRGRYAGGTGELSRAGRHRRRPASSLWRGARHRRAHQYCKSSSGPEIVMTDKPDLDHLRQWIGRSTQASDIVTAQLVKGLRATLFMEIGDPKPGDAAPWTVHWCLAQPVFPMSELGPDGHPTRGGFLPPVPLPRRMWAGGELEFFDTLRVGDETTRTSRIADVTMKTGSSGVLCFVSVDHLVTTPRGTALRERQDIVYRDISSAPAAAPAKTAPPPPVAKHRETHMADPVLLFRYSALTFNGHRIHYDRDYVTKVEGYPGLIFHGPMQAAFIVELAAKLHGGAAPKKFSYRGVQPLFEGSEFSVNANDTGTGMELWTANSDGQPTMKGTATW